MKHTEGADPTARSLGARRGRSHELVEVQGRPERFNHEGATWRGLGVWDRLGSGRDVSFAPVTRSVRVIRGDGYFEGPEKHRPPAEVLVYRHRPS